MSREKTLYKAVFLCTWGGQVLSRTALTAIRIARKGLSLLLDHIDSAFGGVILFWFPAYLRHELRGNDPSSLKLRRDRREVEASELSVQLACFFVISLRSVYFIFKVSEVVYFAVELDRGDPIFFPFVPTDTLIL